MNTDEAKGQRDVIGACFLLNKVEHLQRERLGAVHARAARCAQAHLKLAGVHFWKNLRADPVADEFDYQHCRDQIRACDEPSDGHNLARSPCVELLKTPEPGRGFLRGFNFVLSICADRPRRKHRHECAGEQIRGDHREADCQRERHEQRPGRAFHEIAHIRAGSEQNLNPLAQCFASSTSLFQIRSALQARR